MESLFSRVTRYPREPSINPHENRLTEVTAATLERVDGLALQVVIELLRSAAGRADDEVRLAEHANPTVLTQWLLEAERLHAAMDAALNLGSAHVRVRTQVATPKGRFVDLEVWLRPEKPADTRPDVLVWLESKQGSDIHGDQLDVYLTEVHSHPAAHKVVLLLAPRGQVLATTTPIQVPRVDWETVGETVADLLKPRAVAAQAWWLLDEYANYLREEGLMVPDALTAAHALALMDMQDADAALAGICEHAEAHVRKHWREPTGWQTPRGASQGHAFGRDYWATYVPHCGDGEQAPTWLGAWFEWGVADLPAWQYLDAGTLRGSVAVFAGAGFETKGQPSKVQGNEEWLAQRIGDGFVSCWFNFYRLARFKYPDELLVATTVEDQGRILGEWVVAAFEKLAGHVPPN